MFLLLVVLFDLRVLVYFGVCGLLTDSRSWFCDLLCLIVLFYFVIFRYDLLFASCSYIGRLSIVCRGVVCVMCLGCVYVVWLG